MQLIAVIGHRIRGSAVCRSLLPCSCHAPPARSGRLQGFGVAHFDRLRPGQMGVEAHGDDTQQEAAARADCEPVRIYRDQTIARKFAQAHQFSTEVRGEIQPVALFECGDVERAVTHQLLDRIGANQIVFVEREATHDRQAAGIQCRVVADRDRVRSG